MNEMIERAVKALQAIDFKVGSPNYYQAVREVILAIREPTEAMVEAGNKYTDWADGADEAWKSMIDIILEEKHK